MKVEMLMNGVKKIVLIPEDDVEKAFLESFSKSSNLESTLIDKQMPILDIIIHDGLIIKSGSENG